VLAAAADAMLAPQQVRHDMTGEFTLACTHTVAGYFVTPLLTRFRRIFPSIKINLVERDRPEIERRIVSGEVDIAVCLLSPLQSRSAGNRAAGKFETAPVVARKSSPARAQEDYIARHPGPPSA
jgi:DNA-binding transcriptional LysR family regulator